MKTLERRELARELARQSDEELQLHVEVLELELEWRRRQRAKRQVLDFFRRQETTN